MPMCSDFARCLCTSTELFQAFFTLCISREVYYQSLHLLQSARAIVSVDKDTKQKLQ